MYFPFKSQVCYHGYNHHLPFMDVKVGRSEVREVHDFAKLHVANFIKIAKYKVIRCLKLLLAVFLAKHQSQEKR
jgi:hypothetical protein